MANEITLSLSVNATKNFMSHARRVSGLKINQTTAGHQGQMNQLNATSSSILTYPMITNPGWAYFKNHDAINHVEVGPDNPSNDFFPLLQFAPGAIASFRLNPNLGSAIRGKTSHTTETTFESWVLEN